MEVEAEMIEKQGREFRYATTITVTIDLAYIKGAEFIITNIDQRGVITNICMINTLIQKMCSKVHIHLNMQYISNYKNAHIAYTNITYMF